MGRRPFTDTSHVHYTTPGHIPAHLPPFETLRANRVRKVGWVELFRSTRGPSLMGDRAAPPSSRGLGPVASAVVRPAPYGGPGCPAPPWGAGATLALVSRDPSWSVVESGV